MELADQLINETKIFDQYLVVDLNEALLKQYKARIVINKFVVNEIHLLGTGTATGTFFTTVTVIIKKIVDFIEIIQKSAHFRELITFQS